jgi:hypothetical protein
MTETKFFSLLGKITLEHSYLEETLTSLLLMLINPFDINIGGAVLEDYSSIGKKLQLLRRIYRYIYSNYNETILQAIIEEAETASPISAHKLFESFGFTGEDYDEQVKSTLSLENFEKIYLMTLSIIERRNKIIHSEWYWLEETNYELYKIKLTLDGLRETKTLDLNIDLLKNLLCDYEELQEALSLIHSRIWGWARHVSEEGRFPKKDNSRTNLMKDSHS